MEAPFTDDAGGAGCWSYRGGRLSVVTQGPHPTADRRIAEAARREPAGLERDESDRAHRPGKLAGVCGGLRHVEQIEQRAAAHGFDAAQSLFKWLAPRVAPVLAQVRARLLQALKEGHMPPRW